MQHFFKNRAGSFPTRGLARAKNKNKNTWLFS